MKWKIDSDPAAREALWRAILIAIEKLEGRCSVYSSCVPKAQKRLYGNTPMPDIENRQFMEAGQEMALGLLDK